MKTSKLIWQLAIAMTVLALALVYYLAHDYFEPEVSLVVPADPAYDLRSGPCVSALPGGGRVSFAIEPGSIPVMKPLQFDVQVSGIEATAVEVDFAGVDMNMGFNRYRLAAVSAGMKPAGWKLGAGPERGVVVWL